MSLGGWNLHVSFPSLCLYVFCDFSIMRINYFVVRKKFLTTKIVFLIVMHFHCRKFGKSENYKKEKIIMHVILPRESINILVSFFLVFFLMHV